MNDTDSKQLIEHLGAISKSLQNVEHLTRAMAQAKVAEAIYPGELLNSLLADCQSLFTADVNAFSEMNSNHEDLESMSYEERVQEHGEEKAKKQLEPLTKALDKRKKTAAAYDKFRTQHPIVAGLHDSAMWGLKAKD